MKQMRLSRKGIKMNISKCLKNYNIEKSEEKVTKVRGQHEITNGYRFVDSNENQIILYWHDDKMDFERKHELIVKMFDTLIKHGFNGYLKLDKEQAQIIISKFKE